MSHKYGYPFPSSPRRHLPPLLEPRSSLCFRCARHQQHCRSSPSWKQPKHLAMLSLQVGVQRKLTNNLSACRSSGIYFVPLVVEALGGLAEDTNHHQHQQSYREQMRSLRLCLPPSTCLAAWQSRCGEAMPPSGSTGSPPFPPPWTA